MAEHRDAPSILRTLRDISPPMWLLLVGMFINRMGTLLQFYLLLYLTGRGFEEYAAGIALGAFGVGSVVGVLAGGAVCDRLGFRTTIVGSMAGAGALTGALVHLSDIRLIVVTTAVIGLLAQFYRPASSTMLVTLTPRDHHVMVFAVYRLAFNLGSTAGPLLGALLIAHSYELLFYVDAVTSIVFALFALGLPRATSGDQAEELNEEMTEAGAEATRGSYLVVLRDRPYVLYLLAVFLYSVVYIQHLATLPLQVQADGHGPGFYAALLSTNAALIIALELPLTTFVQRLRAGVVVGFGIALVGVGMNLNAAGPSVVMFLVAMLVWTAGEMVASPSVLAYPGRVAPRPSRSRYVAASAFSMQTGFAIGPTLGVALWTMSSRGLWWACSVAGIAGAAAAVAGMASPDGSGDPVPSPAAGPGADADRPLSSAQRADG